MGEEVAEVGALFVDHAISRRLAAFVVRARVVEGAYYGEREPLRREAPF